MFEEYNDISRLDDGPYVFRREERWRIRWVEKGVARKKDLSDSELLNFKSKDSRYFDPKYLAAHKSTGHDDTCQFSGVGHVAVLSDIHGQYDLLIEILQNQKIIDGRQRWEYGKGHLVILGDVLDRGDQVQECVWFLFQLEQQAKSAGGRLHFVLGNHEVMVLQGDLRYVHPKYRRVSEVLHSSYDSLFGPDSVLGSWLREKPAMISINDLLFVHAGLAPDLATYGFSIKEINREFRKLLSMSPGSPSIPDDPRLQLLHGTQGPVWYRGHIYDPEFNEFKLQNILEHFGMRRMIVGHTSMPQVKPFFNKQLIVVDSGIKLGDRGEIMLVENGNFFAGDRHGNRRGL